MQSAKWASVLVAVVLVGSVNAAIINVPWDSNTQTYHVSWAGYGDINSGNYDPIQTSGTFQKQNGDKWIATDWNWGGNYGTWEYQFTGGPGGNLVKTVSVDLNIYQDSGQYAASWANFGTASDQINQGIYALCANTSYSGVVNATFGSEASPLNVGAVYVNQVIVNGWYPTAVQLTGMTITATPTPEPATLGFLALGVMGLIRRK